jgi:riboflavin-specific deaminase-like protein
MIDLDNIWPALMDCRSWMREHPPETAGMWVFSRDASGGWSFQAKDMDATWDVSINHIRCPWEQAIPGDMIEALGVTGLYLRLMQSIARARKERRVFVTAHCAQSLDGFIATRSGHSQWIGNHANLVHAHRLRALHDGILVGANTLRIDRPQLTVRHVTGENPLRTVLTSREEPDAEMRELLEAAPMTLLLHPKGNGSASSRFSEKVETLALETTGGKDPSLDPAVILRHLLNKSVQSLMIEGGGFTISRFLKARLIDELLGDGIASLQVEPCERIGNAWQYPAQMYPMGGQVLYTLQPETV